MPFIEPLGINTTTLTISGSFIWLLQAVFAQCLVLPIVQCSGPKLNSVTGQNSRLPVVENMILNLSNDNNKTEMQGIERHKWI